MTLLLDTNACIGFLRGRSPLADRFREHEPRELAICSTVLAELTYGALHSQDSSRHIAAVEEFVAPLSFVPFDRIVAVESGRVRATLSARGELIGPYDLQIAATALVFDMILVTHNIREFARVDGLQIEDWEAS